MQQPLLHSHNSLGFAFWGEEGSGEKKEEKHSTNERD
jgi:hypothetical protein